MKIRELAEYCKAIDNKCTSCEHTRECISLCCSMDGLTPCSIVRMVDENREVYDV